MTKCKDSGQESLLEKRTHQVRIPKERSISFLISTRAMRIYLRGCVVSGGSLEDVVPLVYDEQHEIYKKQGIRFNELIHLESIGLIQFQTLTFRKIELPKMIAVFYYGRPVVLNMPNEANNILSIGKVLLTKTGQELALICGSKPVEGFFDYVVGQWKGQGYIINETEADSKTNGGSANIADTSNAEANNQ